MSFKPVAMQIWNKRRYNCAKNPTDEKTISLRNFNSLWTHSVFTLTNIYAYILYGLDLHNLRKPCQGKKFVSFSEIDGAFKQHSERKFMQLNFKIWVYDNVFQKLKCPIQKFCSTVVH